MKLSPEEIRDFQKAYYQDFGKELSEAEAEEMSNHLIPLLGIVYRPIPEKDDKQ